MLKGEESGRNWRSNPPRKPPTIHHPFFFLFTNSLSLSFLTCPLPFPAWHSLHVVSLIVTRSPLLSQTYFFTRNERGIFASFFSPSSPHPFFPLSRRRRAKLGTFSAPRPTLAKLKWLLFSSSYTCTSIYLSLPSENAASTNGNVASPSSSPRGGDL